METLNLQPESGPTDGRWPPRGVGGIPDFVAGARATLKRSSFLGY